MSSDSPIRVLSLTYAEDGYANAQQVNAREIARRLDPSRFVVTLLSDGSGPASVASLPHVRRLRVGRHGRAARILWRLLRGGFDVLLYPGAGFPESIFVRLPRWWPSRRRSSVVLPIEGDVRQLDEVADWIRRRVDRLHRHADVLLPITEYVADTLRARCGRAGEVVPVGVDLDAFRPRGGDRAPGPLRVVSVGTVKAWKRPELARRAAAALPEVQFAWVGDGEARASEAAAAPQNLLFEGALPHDALPERLRAADVLLHPSRMEGLPKVVLEAMASGLPVVVFDDYRPRFVADAEAGFVVSSDAEMVAALRRLEASESLRERMGLAARAAVSPFSWDVVAQTWASLLEQAAAHARAGVGGRP